ncbi:mesoderm posterior protein 1-like [Anguilla anguilla]|uniref:mesoderm posterior protein 1-like n=1 Tax=Anguilla anguilla TaxID=7936 RepID=UPI0015AA44A2|nr:mesoderm posterior protein 1-like [Anguilla anguilla]
MDVSSPYFSYGDCARYPWNASSSDSEFYSQSSPDAPSPACSADLSLPPSPQAWGPGPGARSTPQGAPRPSVSPSSGEEGAPAGRGKRRGRRAKNPSKQRQSASEKEKLRMRDLTKALHHLRTFLPPSVAPAGQTLTKIETLRLAIRYIAHLSDQLGLGEQAPSRRGDPSACGGRTEDPAGFCQRGSAPGFWGHPEQGQGRGQGAGGYQRTPMPACPAQNPGAQRSRFAAALEVSLQDELLNSSLDSLLQSPSCTETAPSYQMYSRDLSSQIIPQEFWV